MDAPASPAALPSTPRLVLRDHIAIAVVVAAPLGIMMFDIATLLMMSPVVVLGLMGFSTAVACIGEKWANPNKGVYLRGLGTSAAFCVSLMVALWFTTGHQGVLMWVVFSTSTTVALAVAGCRKMSTWALSAA